jgi:hypothetical protein
MHQAFANRDDVLVLNVFYTKENAKELEIQTNLAVQDQLVAQWNGIKKTINDLIMQSNF